MQPCYYVYKGLGMEIGVLNISSETQGVSWGVLVLGGFICGGGYHLKTFKNPISKHFKNVSWIKAIHSPFNLGTEQGNSFCFRSAVSKLARRRTRKMLDWTERKSGCDILKIGSNSRASVLNSFGQFLSDISFLACV